jgi:hypothetical protein
MNERDSSVKKEVPGSATIDLYICHEWVSDVHKITVSRYIVYLEIK